MVGVQGQGGEGDAGHLPHEAVCMEWGEPHRLMQASQRGPSDCSSQWRKVNTCVCVCTRASMCVPVCMCGHVGGVVVQKMQPKGIPCRKEFSLRSYVLY